MLVNILIVFSQSCEQNVLPVTLIQHLLSYLGFNNILKMLAQKKKKKVI